MQNSANQSYLNKLWRSAVIPYLSVVFIVFIITVLCLPLINTERYYLVSYLLLFALFIMATVFRLGPVLLAATLSSLAWNFFFIPPHNTFHIEKTDDILMFALFFSIAMLNGVLTTRVRRQEQLARDREVRTKVLFQLTHQLSKAGSIDEVLKIAIEEIREQFGFTAFFILQDGNNILFQTGRLQKEKKLNTDEYSVAEWCFKNRTEVGAFTTSRGDLEYTFYPMLGTKVNPGVLATKQEKPVAGENRTFWLTFITQISNAIEREFLAEMATKARFLDESGRLYKTLFNSISHEFRIPVATIMGASDSLLSSLHPANIQSELYNEIFTASVRLNRLIENLLNMSRLESGQLSVSLDWCDINDLFNKVLEDLSEELEPFKVKVAIPENMPLVKIDFGLMEQVLYNLLFNATQYSAPSTKIELSSAHENDELVIEIADRGTGFPESTIEKVFTKFYRVDDTKTGGLGLGLSIVKGFVEAHSGKITVESRKTSGARFIIRIPTEKPDINNLYLDNE